MREIRLPQYALILLVLLSTVFLFARSYLCFPPIAGFEVKQEYHGRGPFGGDCWTVHFTDSSTGSITSWSWDFHNDGHVDSNEQNPSYVFDKAGPHTFKLVVEGLSGRGQIIKTIMLNETPMPSLPPIAIFAAYATNGTAPFEVKFVDQAAGDITEWHWDFDGDSKTDSTEQNPIYVYKTPGTYDVKLTVLGPGGSNSITRKGYIQVK